jgi:hypothetical protein
MFYCIQLYSLSAVFTKTYHQISLFYKNCHCIKLCITNPPSYIFFDLTSQYLKRLCYISKHRNLNNFKQLPNLQWWFSIKPSKDHREPLFGRTSQIYRSISFRVTAHAHYFISVSITSPWMTSLKNEKKKLINFWTKFYLNYFVLL